MKLFFTLLFLSFSIQISSQHRFVYNVSFKIDSTNLDNVQYEVFNLDYADGKSIFYNETFAKLDSMITNGGTLSKNNVPSPKLDILITKDLQNNEVDFLEVLGFSSYLVKDPRQIKWQIESEIRIVEDQKLQKATTDFGGRKWIAWFSDKYNIADGPYKFHGLPGLIIDLYDENRHYTFQLAKITSIDQVFSVQSFARLGIRTIPLDFQSFLEQKKVYKNNPEKFYYDFFNNSGVKIESAEIRKMTLQSEQRRKQKNNTIELTQ